MRRFLSVCVCLLLALPFSTFAQDEELGWELDEDSFIDVADIGFRFYYPVGWVWGSGSGGISIAETQADLDAQLDDDDATVPEGRIMSVLGIPLASLPAADEPQSMDDYADFVVEVGEITETERIELPIMSRRSISVIGENARGRFGIGTIWTQNGYLVLTSLGVPDEATLNDLAYTWGVTIGNFDPLEAETLGKGTLASPVSQFTMNYPDGWTADPDQPDLIVYELEADIGAELTEMEGINLSVIDAPLTDIGFEADAVLEDIVTSMAGNVGLDETATHEEFIFLGQPAIVSWGEIDDDNGGTRGLILTSSVIGENIIIFVMFTPTAERAAEFMPTWVAMMQSVVSTATE
jgi:hypothetical protein